MNINRVNRFNDDNKKNIPWSEPCRKIGNEREVNDDEEGNMKV